MFSKYMARFFKIYGHLGRFSDPPLPTLGAKRKHQRRHVSITTGVTTCRPTGVDRDQAGYDTTRPETHVGRRRVEGCLGGNDDGAGGVDEGVENISIPLRKRGRLASSEMGTFNGFTVFSGKEDSCFLEILKF